MEVRLYSDEKESTNFSVSKVINIISNPAHDIIEIETGSEIRMLPFIDVFVKEINTKDGFISIFPPEGWFE
jgi:RimM protein, required for 16S rRNA processing